MCNRSHIDIVEAVPDAVKLAHVAEPGLANHR
jgi:hypothetical protein